MEAFYFLYHSEWFIFILKSKFPDLNVATSGINKENTLVSARELLGCVMYGLEEDGETIPIPTPLDHLNFNSNERTVLIDCYMPSIRMANVNKSVNRTKK